VNISQPKLRSEKFYYYYYYNSFKNYIIQNFEYSDDDDNGGDNNNNNNNKSSKLNSNGVQNGDNTTNRPVSNCCDAKDPAQESELPNLKKVISRNIEKAAEL